MTEEERAAAETEQQTAREKEATKRERQSREDRPTVSEQSLTRAERRMVAEHGRLSALTVYSIILREGEEELHRPMASLWWSGIAAGIGISTSVLAEGILHKELSGHTYLNLIESLGYTVGFVLVILSRLQLFTENTISVVLPVLAAPKLENVGQAARLWGIVFLANMVGTFLTALITIYGGTASAEVVEGIMGVSRHLLEYSASESFLRGIPAGFFIAAIVWMLPSSKGFELFVIVLFTYLIAVGGFTHVIAGSFEIFALVLSGELGLGTGIFAAILPTLAGNILGGTGLFAMLAYGQVHEEM